MMEPQQIQQPLQQQINEIGNSNNGLINGGIVLDANNANNNDGFNGVLYVKVMTDEQLEILRTQIAVYAVICEQLVEMHKSITAQQDLAGVRLGNLYCDPLITSVGPKITARQRWTPTAIQLQILERIFEQGTGTPSKQKIKEITSELSQHGQISETNVYNWFQNRRARSKRKQLNNAHNNGELEVETDGDSPKDKKTKPKNFQNHELSSSLHTIESNLGQMDTVFDSDGNSKNVEDISELAFYESILQNPRIEELVGKMEEGGSLSDYQNQTTKGFRMSG